MSVTGSDAVGVQPGTFFVDAGCFAGTGALGCLLPPELRLRSG